MFPELTTERFLLQQIVAEDQPFIYEGLSNPAVILYYGVNYQSLEATKSQMDWYDKMLAENSGIAWKIVDKTTGQKIGVLSIYNYKTEHNKAELGFWLLPEFWGKGVVIEALNNAVDFWKTERHLHRLEAFVEVGNNASCKVLEKAGFFFEGEMKDCEIKNGAYISLLIYALLLD